MRKIISALIFLTILPVLSHAFTVDGISYSITSIDDNTVKVVANASGYSGNVTIPSEVTYKDVTYTVTAIGSAAFCDDTELVSVSLPSTIKTIEHAAFCRSSIQSLALPEGVTTIASAAFKNCTSLKSVNIPSTVNKIGDFAFYGCSNLEGDIVIPDGVGEIEYQAFYGCSKITSVTIPNSVTSIDHEAFMDCVGITGKVIIPEGVTSIATHAFYNCTGLTSINVAEDNSNYASIDGVLYSKDKTTVITCPHGKTGSVTIPNGVTSIGSYTFYEHTGLTSITIPNSVTEISGSAFYGCTGLTSVTIGNGVTSIGKGVFTSCTGLTSMTVEATNPPSCDVNKYNLGLGMPNYNIPLYVPAGSVDAYKAAKEWKRFTNIQAIPATGVNEATAEKNEVKKIIDRNGIIYIEKDGTRYFLNGGKAE